MKIIVTNVETGVGLVNGVQNSTATRGPKGDPGDIGPQGPQGPKGADGTMVFEDLTAEQRESLRGPEGPPGQKGEDGMMGPQGEPGPQGPVGPQGEKGLDGAPGVAGEKGADGVAGAEGPMGPAGPQGLKGDQGIQGPKGDIGETGPQGPQGIQGEVGPKGETGPQGPQGLKGDQGIQGLKGDTGLQGPRGFVYTPIVKDNVLSFENDGSLANPDAIDFNEINSHLEGVVNQLSVDVDDSSKEITDARAKADGTTFEKLGERLNTYDTSLSSKADKSELNTVQTELQDLNTTIATKADKSELTPLQTELDAHEARIAAEEAKSAAHAAAFSVSGADATFNGAVSINNDLYLPTGKAVGSYPVTAVIPSYGGTTSKWHTLYSFSGPNEIASLGLHGINFILSLSRSWNTNPPESYTFAVDISYGVATFTQLSGTTHQKLLYAIRVMKEDNLIQAGKKSLKVEVLATDSTGNNQWFASLHNVHAPEMTIKSHAFVPTNDAGTLAGQHVTNGGIVESGWTSNGTWTKFYDGTLIQRGTGATYLGNVEAVTFPVPFYGGEISVVVTRAGSTNDSVTFGIIVAQSNFSVKSYVNNTTPTYSINLNYIAMGRWK